MSRSPRLAVITTAYHPMSHSDVIVSRWLEPRATDREVGWPPLGHDKPRTEIASLYIQQFPENDIGRTTAARHNVPIYSSVREALTLGGDTLAVDGVLLIAEHGDFPLNEFFQKLYPRRELFDEIVAVFSESGRGVPVFNDKHLSYNSDSARYMVAKSRELGFPLMAGSSIPLGGYEGAISIPGDIELEEGVAVFYDGVESYGYHSIEFLQSQVARRRGGESGIASVTTYFGDGFWQALSDGVWSEDLFETAIKAAVNSKQGHYRDNVSLHGVTEKQSHNPAAFVFNHLDGLKTSHLFLHGHIQDFALAIHEKDGAIYTGCDSSASGHATFFRHFAILSVHIEEFMLTGKSPFPIEHYLLSTIALNSAVEALATPGRLIETPQLNYSYHL
jgi:hypothetical protein